MSMYPTAAYLAVGDAVSWNGTDYVPASGDYINLMDPMGTLILAGGLVIPSSDLSAQENKKAGAVIRLRSARAMPIRPITLTLQNRSGGTDATSIAARVRAIMHKLEQARAASGPQGHGTGVVLLLRLATNRNSSLGEYFAFWDVLHGVFTAVDQQVAPGVAYGATLELWCLPFGRSLAQTWPGVNTFSATLANTYPNALYVGSTAPSWQGSAGGATTLYTGGAVSSAPFTTQGGSWQWWGNPTISGNFADYLPTSTTAPASFTDYTSQTFLGVNDNDNILLGTAIYQLPAGGSYPGGAWELGMGFYVGSSSLSGAVSPVYGVYLINGSTHAVKATIIPQTVVASALSLAGTAGNVYTILIADTGAAYTAATGDYILLEYGVQQGGTGGGNNLDMGYAAGGTMTIGGTPGVWTLNSSPQTFMSALVTPSSGAIAAVGSIGGHLGALLQLHILDQSTAGAINRLTIARRAVPGINGGMREIDWTGCINADTTAVFGETVNTGDANSVGGDNHALTVTDGTARGLARFTGLNSSGISPLYESGLYDVFVRVRESIDVAVIPIDLVLTPQTVITAPLPPDTYSVRLVGQTASSALSSASPAATITLTYPWTPNIFFDGFEGGDMSQFLQVSDNGSNQSKSTGDLTVQAAWALAGGFGLRARGGFYFPTTPAASNASYLPFVQRVERVFSVPNSNTLYMSAWMKVQGGYDTQAIAHLMGFESSNLAARNQAEQYIGGVPNTYVATGDWGGLIAWVGHDSGFFVLHYWNGASVGSTALTVPTAEVAGQPIWVQIAVSTAFISSGGTYTVQLWIKTYNGTYTTGAITATMGISAAPSVSYVDTACWGLKAVYGDNGAMDVLYDDCMIWTATSQLYPNQGISVNATDPNGDIPIAYIQQGSNGYHAGGVVNSSYPYLLNLATLTGPASQPLVTPQPDAASFYAQIGIIGSSNLATTPTVKGTKTGNKWYLLYLGTLPLPPNSRMEGMNPAFGSGSGDFGFQLDLYAASGAGGTSNTIETDAMYILPNDEPQIQAYMPGLANTTLGEWVVETRRDGRSGAVMRNPTDLTTIIATPTVNGYIDLSSGNQSLLIIAEREDGVHDVQNTKFGAQLRWQPLLDFIDDNPTAY